MRRSALTTVFGLALWMLPTAASAGPVTCPTPALGGQDNNQYTVNSALDCVYGPNTGADGNIGSQGDAFTSGLGNLEDSYVAPAPWDDTSPTWGATWTFVCSSGTAVVTGGGSANTDCDGLSYTTSSLQSGTWSITDTDFANYALGIKDGRGPQWAVFLLDSLSGVMSMTGGSFSHFVLYGTGTPTQTTDVPTTDTPTTDTTIPEPASLLLLGIGLGFAGNRLRRRYLTA